MSSAKRRAPMGRALGLFVALSVALAACGGGSESGGGGSGASGGEPYKIGFNDDLSGPIAFAGTVNLAGFMTYIDYVNKEKGGVNGKQIKVDTVDNRADGAVALSNYRDLVRSGALATVGYTSSVAWSAAGAVADRTKVVQLGLSGVDKWTEEEHPYLFKYGQTQAVALNIQFQHADDLVEKEGLENPTVGIFTITTASGPIFEEAAKKLAAERGWQIVNTQAVDPAASDCSAQAAKMAAAKPDLIISNLESAGEDVVCYKALDSRGFDGPIVNSFYSSAEKTFEQLKADNWNAERVYVWPTDESVPAAQTLNQRAQKYGHANKIADFFTDGYVAAMLVAKALETCGAECDAKGFRDSLEGISSLDTGGLAGPNYGFTTGPNGHMAAPEGKMYRWDGGEGQAVPTTDWICGLPGRC